MADKANRLSITGAGQITLTNPKTIIAGFRWTGSELVHATGKTFRFSPAMTAEISAAVAASHGGTYESRTGAQIVDGDREGWEFAGVSGDAIGHYTRTVVEPVTQYVSFGKEDLA